MKATFKRVISTILIVCMLCSLCYIPGMAASGTTPMKMSLVYYDTSYNEITSAVVGDTVYLGIKLEDYIPIMNYDWAVTYNKDRLG